MIDGAKSHYDNFKTTMQTVGMLKGLVMREKGDLPQVTLDS